MLAPDLQFMVHTAEIVDEEGIPHRGSRVKPVDKGAAEPPEWRLRDFAFAAYSGANAPGLREVHFAGRTIWAFASAREHCEEIVIFRSGTDTRAKWEQEEMRDPTFTSTTVRSDMFFMMRMRQIASDTPLMRQFNGEWGFWESFYVPLIDEQQTMKSLLLMDPGMCEDHFEQKRLPVTCHRCPEGSSVLTIPDDLVARFEVKAVCKTLQEWANLCTKIGDDMRMEEACIIDHKHLNPGDECVEAYTEVQGTHVHARLVKHDLQQLPLPVIAVFKCELRVKEQWDPDMIYLRHKYDAMNSVYTMNLGGGLSSMSGRKADPWYPVARLAISALTKVFSRFPDIRTVLDVGCGDLAWMQYFLEDHPAVSYVGVDLVPYVLATNFRRFPKMQFIQTDLSNLSGVEVMPLGCDLVLGKDVFNHMVLPDAVAALKRVIATRPRFFLTHVHESADNTGWETRIDKHLHYTKYNYNAAPFSLPFPVVEVQRISEDQCWVLYEVTPEAALKPSPLVEQMVVPKVADLAGFSEVQHGDLAEPEEEPRRPDAKAPAEVPPPGAFAPPSRGERTNLISPVTELPDRAEEAKRMVERRPIKGMPAVEFRAKCDLIFEKFDADGDGALKYEELAAVMASGGRPVEEYSMYEGLCRKLECDAQVGLDRKDLHAMFEKAPQAVWDEAFRSLDPFAGMVRRGAEALPETSHEKPLNYFLFEDDKQFAMILIEVNTHLYYGAAEFVTRERVQAYFGAKRVEVHICAPGSYGAKDLCLWKVVVQPLTADVVPEDCQLVLEDTAGRFGSLKVTVKLMKSQPGKKWYKAGQSKVASGNNQRV